MRGVAVELPAAARAKLDELVLAKDLALDASRSSNARLQALPIDADARIRERLEAERDRANEKHRRLAMLVSRCNQWHVELRLAPGTSLELQPPYNHVQLAPGETLADAVAKIRLEIVGKKQEIVAVKSAPLRLESKMEALALYLDRLVGRAKPKVGFDIHGNARVLWTEDLVVGKDDLLGLLAFIMGPETIAAAFARDFEEEPEREDAVTPLQRQERLNELAEALLKLERRECAWVECDDTIVPRHDTDPRAYLGVRIATQAQTPAQAAVA
jgi:hypothetical protein